MNLREYVESADIKFFGLPNPFWSFFRISPTKKGQYLVPGVKKRHLLTAIKETFFLPSLLSHSRFEARRKEEEEARSHARFRTTTWRK